MRAVRWEDNDTLNKKMVFSRRKMMASVAQTILPLYKIKWILRKEMQCQSHSRIRDQPWRAVAEALQEDLVALRALHNNGTSNNNNRLGIHNKLTTISLLDQWDQDLQLTRSGSANSHLNNNLPHKTKLLVNLDSLPEIALHKDQGKILLAHQLQQGIVAPTKWQDKVQTKPIEIKVVWVRWLQHLQQVSVLQLAACGHPKLRSKTLHHNSCHRISMEDSLRWFLSQDPHSDSRHQVWEVSHLDMSRHQFKTLALSNFKSKSTLNLTNLTSFSLTELSIRLWAQIQFHKLTSKKRKFKMNFKRNWLRRLSVLAVEISLICHLNARVVTRYSANIASCKFKMVSKPSKIKEMERHQWARQLRMDKLQEVQVKIRFEVLQINAPALTAMQRVTFLLKLTQLWEMSLNSANFLIDVKEVWLTQRSVGWPLTNCNNMSSVMSVPNLDATSVTLKNISTWHDRN